MEITSAMAKDRFAELLRAAEAGEQIIITRHGKPVAQIVPPPPVKRQVVLDGMKDRIKLLPGWTIQSTRIASWPVICEWLSS